MFSTQICLENSYVTDRWFWLIHQPSMKSTLPTATSLWWILNCYTTETRSIASGRWLRQLQLQLHQQQLKDVIIKTIFFYNWAYTLRDVLQHWRLNVADQNSRRRGSWVERKRIPTSFRGWSTSSSTRTEGRIRALELSSATKPLWRPWAVL